MKNNITSEQEKVMDTLHNLIWHRITHDDQYLAAVPEQDSKNLDAHIYFITYKFLEYDDSTVEAIVYLKGKHYKYLYAPQISHKPVWIDEIQDSEVEENILEIGGVIPDGFELYNPNPIWDEATKNEMKNWKYIDNEYRDLPF